VLPEKPSIAVLPFDNMSNDPDQEYFADGITEDIITALSHLRWLFVIARNSTFAYKEQAIDVRAVSGELGVRYVLEGSVRKSSNRVRITAQLIDAKSSGHLWAKRYDRDLDDIFAVQDEITQNVAAAIEPEILAAKGLRVQVNVKRDLIAWDVLMRALSAFWRMTREDSEQAIAMLEQATQEFPDYGPSHSMLAFAQVLACHIGWIKLDQVREHAAALAVVRRQQPNVSVSLLRNTLPYSSPDAFERFAEGLRKAGLAEEQN
jgi:TolB-like protein